MEREYFIGDGKKEKMSKKFIIISIVFLILAGTLYFFFVPSKKVKNIIKGEASFMLRFPEVLSVLALDSSAVAASISNEKVIFTIYGQESQKKDKKGIEIDVLEKELKTKQKKGIVTVNLKRPDASLKKIICDLGADDICEAAFDRSYLDYIASRDNFLANQGKIVFSINKNIISGEIIDAKTKEGASLSGIFSLKLAQNINGASWSAAEISQAEKTLSLAESQEVLASQDRNKKRIANLRLLQLALGLYRLKNNKYPLSETLEKINKANFNESFVYQALTSDARFGINPNSFPFDFQYQSLNSGKEYLLTGWLEGIPKDDARCDKSLSNKEICVYAIRGK